MKQVLIWESVLNIEYLFQYEALKILEELMEMVDSFSKHFSFENISYLHCSSSLSLYTLIASLYA